MKGSAWYAIISMVMHELTKPQLNQFQKTIEDLWNQNHELHGKKVECFTYQGIFYRPAIVPAGGITRLELHEELHSQMENFLKEKAMFEGDMSEIKQALLKLLQKCKTGQDIRDAFPDCISHCLPDIIRLNRTRDTAWSIQDEPRSIRLYEKALPKMEYYSATRLIFS